MLCQATWGGAQEQNESTGTVGGRFYVNKKVGCSLSPLGDLISFLSSFVGWQAGETH
jgi:hypothetical protein